MTLLEWKESYSVGDSVFDNDHRRLIDLINRVEEADREGLPVDWALDELEEYARYHFGREETRMEALGYPALEAHRKEHAAFIEWLETVKSTYHAAPEAHAHLAAAVNAYLRDWLDNHILKTDMAYKPHLAG